MLLTELLSLEDRSRMKVATYDGIRILGITCDSRSVDKGYLFAAIPGGQRDGRQFIPEALDRGASAILAPPGTLLKPNDEVPLLIYNNHF